MQPSCLRLVGEIRGGRPRQDGVIAQQPPQIALDEGRRPADALFETPIAQQLVDVEAHVIRVPD
jgi:hypothetical protein